MIPHRISSYYRAMSLLIDGDLKQKVNSAFSSGTGKPLDDKETSEIIFNLQGYAETLLKMSREEDISGQNS